MPRWMLAIVAAVIVVYRATVLAAATAAYLIPAAILALLLLGYVTVEHLLSGRHMRPGGDTQAAMRDDEDWPLPSAHLTPDDETPAGDTTEVHSEINPHDLPPDHPGRQAAEKQVAEAGTFETTGNERGGAGGRFRGRDDATEERTGEGQRSAERAKSTVGRSDEGQYGEGRTSTPGQRP